MLLTQGTLAEHHRRCDQHFAAARAAAEAQNRPLLLARMNLLREAVLEHFRHEEERIFPLYEEASGIEGATEHLCAQHDDMRATLWVIATLDPEAESARYLEELTALQDAFDAHAAGEERDMYPILERVLSARLR